MAHEYYLKDFGMKMHLSLAGGHQSTQAGVIMCPTHAGLHKREICKHTNSQNGKVSTEWQIDGIDRTFNSGEQIIAVYDLVPVNPQDVDWII